MDLRAFLRLKTPDARKSFADRCGTSIGHLNNIMYGIKSCATDLAVRIERESEGAVTRPELRSDWANHWPELSPPIPDEAGVSATAASDHGASHPINATQEG